MSEKLHYTEAAKTQEHYNSPSTPGQMGSGAGAAAKASDAASERKCVTSRERAKVKYGKGYALNGAKRGFVVL